MRLKYIANALGLICKYIGMVIILPILIAIYYKEYNSILPFITTAVISILIGFILQKNNEKQEMLNDLKKAEALAIVALSWIVFGLLASIPYYFYGFNFINATFEAVSGITTTGATILTNFDYPKTIFFYRSFTQWLGGMGIIVLFIAVLPQFAVAGRQMFFAEAPGPTEDKITPRIRYTATALWGLYIILTIIEIILLYLAKMPLFDAICNSLSTLSAGGLSPNPESIGGYNSSIITWIITFFMFLSGANFALQYNVILKKKTSLFLKNQEFLFYTFLIIITSLLMAITIHYDNLIVWSKAIRDSFFNIISIITSTGFSSFDFQLYSPGAKIFLLIVTLTGGCAGSAAGGIKVVRILLILKYLSSEIKKILHPNGVFPIKLDNKIVSKEVMNQILAFVIFYLLIAILSSIIVIAIERDLTIGISGTLSTLNNIGPGFGLSIGPMGNFDSLNNISKFIFIINMLIGRLELIPFLAMLHPDFWRFKLN